MLKPSWMSKNHPWQMIHKTVWYPLWNPALRAEVVVRPAVRGKLVFARCPPARKRAFCLEVNEGVEGTSCGRRDPLRTHCRTVRCRLGRGVALRPGQPRHGYWCHGFGRTSRLSLLVTGFEGEVIDRRSTGSAVRVLRLPAVGNRRTLSRATVLLRDRTTSRRSGRPSRGC